LFGTDEVAPATQEKYLKIYSQYQALWERLTPEASEKVRKGNYERLFDEARRKVRNWEAAQKTGRTPEIQTGKDDASARTVR